MKQNSKRRAKAQESRIRSLVSKVHILVAVVAIIECLVLISLTTYSWIETSSTLIIETGKQSLTDSDITRIPISKALNYKFTINSATGNDTALADLNSFFSLAGQSSTQNLYRYARASTANGKDYYFKKESPSSGYRLGDIIDINSSYTYFDFKLSNKGSQSGHKFKFYFADADVFTVTNDTSSLTDDQLLTVKNAMRISFQTGTGTPKIYAPTAQTYNAVSATDGATTSVTATAIQASENQRLFTISKNSEQDISVRIWLEERATDLSGISGEDLAGLNIEVNLKLTYKQNDYDFIYFDDYTFSSGLENKDNIGGHLTGDYPESNSQRMYFVYQTSSGGDNRHVYPMTIDNSGSNVDALCWVTCDADGNASATVPDIQNSTYITNLTTANNNALTYSYFAYGPWNVTKVNVTDAPSTPLYKWSLNGVAGNSESELRYSAYSVTAISSGNATSTNLGVASKGYGAGGWSYTTPLSRVYFRDNATGITEGAYNSGENYKYITKSVNADTDTDGETTTHRANVLFMNQNATVATTMTEALARATATMYYDKSLDGGKGLFTSWVPSSWLTSTSGNRYFHYCTGGYYNNKSGNYSVINWSAPVATHPSNNDNYIYTALGYQELYTIAYYTARTGAATGIGCWNAIEQHTVCLSTELIDNDVTSAFRYQIGVNINNGGDIKYYALTPDSTNMKFYAFIPVPGTNASPATDYSDGNIRFRSYDKCSTASQTATQNAEWWGRVRNGSRTYYPIAFNTTAATSAAPKGYWNLSVIVDGTYEHLFWVPATILNGVEIDAHILGKFYYNTVGHANNPQYNEITPNRIDEYRWYVPLDVTTLDTAISDSVYYKWVPYAGKDGIFGTSDDTVFTYSNYLSDGIYCVITEASDATPSNAFDDGIATTGSAPLLTSGRGLVDDESVSPETESPEPEAEALDTEAEDYNSYDEYVEDDVPFTDSYDAGE